jgi:coenzyme F420-reducing hydrogenase delta subunit/ferredoxin
MSDRPDALLTSCSATTAEASTPWKPRLVAVICNWCTYAGADMAGTTRRAYPATVRPLRVPCTGRIDPLLVVKAFEQGADGIIVSGCHPGDCHYVQGNLVARRRFATLRALLSFLGLDERRLHFAWVSASEGAKWAALVEEVTEAVRAAGPFAGWAAPTSVAPPRLPLMPPAPRAVAAAAEQEAIATHLRTLVATLLREGAVATFLGYTAGPLPGQLMPAFVEREDEVGSLAWSPRAVNNLAVYLAGPGRVSGKVGLVVKACDAHAVVGLLRESQVAREDVVLVGVACGGVEMGGALAPKCYACDGEAPAVVDWTVSAVGATRGAVASGVTRATGPDPRDAQIDFLAALPPAERAAFWQAQLAGCLRCYGCRAVCPLCYCNTCVVERNRPQWVSATIDAPANLTWNVVRALHAAGRCGGCDECARVCPADVRLDLLNRRVERELATRFDHERGGDPGLPSPLVTFRPEDGQEFVR